MIRWILALAMVIVLALGFAGSASAHYASTAHWHYWPGYASWGWTTDCGKYSPYDNCTTGEPASCYYHTPVCLNHLMTQTIDVHQTDGDIWYNRGRVTGPAC